jgi:hypothetical protein
LIQVHGLEEVVVGRSAGEDLMREIIIIIVVVGAESFEDVVTQE